MKQGTLYAGRLKKAFAKLKKERSAPTPPGDPDDPLRRLVIGVLGAQHGDATAAKAVDRLFQTFVDWNEVRVSTAAEVQQALGTSLGDGTAQGVRLQTVLQSVFDKANRLSLDHLNNIGRREARQYLEGLGGVDEYAAAGVVLWSLGGHAIPVDDRTLEALRAGELVHPDASRAEVQAFLERHVSAADAKTFCFLIGHYTPPKKGAAAGSTRARRTAKSSTGAAARASKRVAKKS